MRRLRADDDRVVHVDVEVRTGGPAIGFQAPPTVMCIDTDVALAYVSTDQAALFYDDVPTLAVVATLEKNPQMIMWDPIPTRASTRSLISARRA